MSLDLSTVNREDGRDVFEANERLRGAEKSWSRQDEYPATDARRESDLWLAFRSPGRISRERSGDRGLESESSASRPIPSIVNADEKPTLSLSLCPSQSADLKVQFCV